MQGDCGCCYRCAASIANKMTPRESEVLKLLAEGKSNRDIAVALEIDEVTVKAHLGRMLRKDGREQSRGVDAAVAG